MKKIALIMPYFGKWPEWKDLFFDSCASNYDVDFYFFTDCGKPDIEAGNLHFIEMEFGEYCQLVSDKLGILFRPSRALKLCDVRPFYSFIHKDILEGYDFWGWADVDLVFGNIRKFYTDELLERYDVLSTHFDRLSGHFAVLRNNEKYTNLCFKIRHWERELQRQENCLLDEAEFSYQILPETRIPRWLYAKTWKYIGWNIAHPLHVWFIACLCKWVGLDKRRIRFVEMNIHPLWTGSDNWNYVAGDNNARKKCVLMDVGRNEECIYCHYLPY